MITWKLCDVNKENLTSCSKADLYQLNVVLRATAGGWGIWQIIHEYIKAF